jgi:hypothetical protein
MSAIPEGLTRAGSVLGRAFLVAVTLLFLASMGGGMAFAAPFLVPIHWLALNTSRSWTRFGWIVLAFLSTTEASAIYAYPLIGRFDWSLGWLGGTAVVLIFVLSDRKSRQHRSDNSG